MGKGFVPGGSAARPLGEGSARDRTPGEGRVRVLPPPLPGGVGNVLPPGEGSERPPGVGNARAVGGVGVGVESAAATAVATEAAGSAPLHSASTAPRIFLRGRNGIPASFSASKKSASATRSLVT